MAFDAGELVATIKAGGLQAFAAGMTRAEMQFRAVGTAAEAQGAQAESAGRRGAAAARTQGQAAQDAARRTTTAARDARTATDDATDSVQRQTRATRDAGTASQQAGADARKAFEDTKASADAAASAVEDTKSAARDLSEVLTVVGAASLAAFTGAAVSSASLDKRLAQLRSLGQYGQRSMDQAKEAALTAGTAYGQTANDVADAQIELQKAGVGLQQQLGGALPGALTLAAAGQTDVAEATSIAVTAMTQFGLSADQTSHTADLLAAGSAKALGSVTDLGAALSQGGLVASQFGWSLDDTVGTLAAFANAGLVGSDAGTSLKTALLQLATPTQQQAALMKQYNLQLYDAEGHFVSSADLAGQLSKQFSGVGEEARNSALGILFGSDAVRAANVLYAEGQGGIQGWIDASNDAGYAARQAGEQQDSLAGDAQKLASVFQNDLIRAGQAVTPILRVVSQTTTGLLDTMKVIPAPIVAGGVALAAIGGAAALAGGAVLAFVPKALEMQVSLRLLRQELNLATYGTGRFATGARVAAASSGALRTAARGTASFLGGPWGIALAVGTVAMIAWQKAIDDAKASSDTLQAAAERGAAGVDKLVESAAQGNNEQRGIFAFLAGQDTDVEKGVLDDLGKKLDQIRQNAENPLVGFFMGSPELGAANQTLKTIGETLATVSDQDAPKAAVAFRALVDQYKLNGQAQVQLLASMPAYSAALESQATQAGRLTGKETEAQKSKILLAQASTDAKLAGAAQASTADDQARAIGEIQGSAAAASDDVRDLAAEIKGLGSATLDSRAAQRDLEQAVDDAADSFQKNGKSLDISTQKGRDNQDAMDKIARTAIAAAAATYTQTGSIQKATASMRDSRKEFVDSIAPILGSRDAARKLADQLGLIPSHVQSLVDVKTNDAAARIQALKDSLLNLPDGEASIYVTAVADGVDPSRARQIAKNATQYKADGGGIFGGTPGVDSVPIMAMPGEHVWTTRETRAAGGHQGVQRIRAAALAGTLSGYASGGGIGEADSARRAAERAITRKAAQIAAQVKSVKVARREAEAADRAYRKAQDTQAGISGKGTSGAKHEATMATRQAKKDADLASKAQKAAEERLADLRKELDAQKQKRTDQTDRGQSLRESSQDLGTQFSRGGYTDPSSPFSAVDLAFQQSRNTDLSAKSRASLNTAATKGNAAMVKLAQQQKDATDQQAAATKALSDAQDAQNKVLDDAKAKADTATGALESVKSSMASLASGVASTVRGFFSLGAQLKDEESSVVSVSHNAGTAAQWDEKVTQVTPGGTTVGTIRSSVTQAANTMQAFTDQLKQLAGMGYSSAIIQDVANLGVEQGSQIAAALLQGTGDDVATINAGYSSMAGASQAAGDFVGAQVLGDQLAVAQQQQATALQNLQVAQDQLTQITAQGQAAVDAADRNAAAVNASIVAAQTALADTVSRAISGSAQSAAAQATAAAAAAAAKQPSLQDVITETLKQQAKDNAALAAKVNGTKTKKKADGGYREAQIQPAGTNILWAEQETGGESYIPHAMSKRARSQQILQATARRFGMVTVPMADGGLYASTNTTDARTMSGDHFDFSGGTWLGTTDQVLAQAERRSAARKARAVNSAGIRRVNP